MNGEELRGEVPSLCGACCGERGHRDSWGGGCVCTLHMECVHRLCEPDAHGFHQAASNLSIIVGPPPTMAALTETCVSSKIG